MGLRYQLRRQFSNRHRHLRGSKERLLYRRQSQRLPGGLAPRLYGSVFGQWNNDDAEILFNFRVTWIPKPGAYLYFVFNQFGDTLDPRGWRMNKTVAMVKFVWYFSTK